jgi:hypothetical protein
LFGLTAFRRADGVTVAVNGTVDGVDVIGRRCHGAVFAALTCARPGVGDVAGVLGE